MSYHTQGRRGRENANRTDRYMRGAGYARGGRVRDDQGDTHISINIGDDTKTKLPGAAPGAPGGAMADDEKKKAFEAGMAAAAQISGPGAPPPMPGPSGPPPGTTPGMLPPGAGGPGMKRGGRVSRAKTVVGPGVREPKKPKNTMSAPPGGSTKGGASQAAKTWGPPIDNKKDGGAVTGKKTAGVIQPGFGSGGGGSAAGRLTKTADERRSS